MGIILAQNQAAGNPPSLAQQWQSGLSHPSPSSMASASPTRSILSNILVANTPQLMLSLLYLSYNNQITRLANAREWLSYAHTRNGLRTSLPQGAQRSTYWLSLPYAYSVPLILVAGFLHWSMSQALFIIDIQVYAADDSPEPELINTVGWSTLALTAATAVLGLMLCSILVLVEWKVPGGMPVVASNSKAISAACHPLPRRYGEALQRLKYRVIAEREDGSARVGFSCTEVKPLRDGQVYV